MVFSDWWTIGKWRIHHVSEKEIIKEVARETGEADKENRRKQKKKRSCIYSPRGCILRHLYSIVFILLLMNFRSNGFSWCFQQRNPGFESLLHYFKCIKKLSPFYWHFETNSLLNFLSQWLFINFDLTNLRNQERWIQNLRMIIKIWQPWPCLWRYIGSWYHETWLILLSMTFLF